LRRGAGGLGVGLGNQQAHSYSCSGGKSAGDYATATRYRPGRVRNILLLSAGLARGGPPGQQPGREIGKSPLIERLAHLAHQVQVEMQVVHSVEAGTENLVALVEVPQVGPRVVATGVAAAFRVDR